MYLCVHLDETLSKKEQVTTLCCSSYFHLWKIAYITIRPNLSDASTAQLISPLILSRLDYSNHSLTFHHLHWTDYKQFKTTLPGFSSENENRTMLLPSGKTTLAPCWGPYPLQNCHTSFQALWEFSSSVPFRTALHLPTLSSSSNQQWKTA